MLTMNIIATVVSLVVMYTEKTDFTKTMQKRKNWSKAGYKNIGEFYEHFDAWRNNEKIEEMSTKDFRNYLVHVYGDNLSYQKQLSINTLVEDIEKATREKNKKNVTKI